MVFDRACRVGELAKSAEVLLADAGILGFAEFGVCTEAEVEEVEGSVVCEREGRSRIEYEGELR